MRIGRFVKRIFLIILPTSCFLLPTSNLYSYQLKYQGKSYSIKEKKINKFSYFKAEDIFDCLGFNLCYENRRFNLKYKNHSALFIESNPFISIDGRLLNFPLTPEIDNKNLYLPLIILNSVLKSLKREKITKKKNALIVSSMRPRLSSIAIDPGHGGKDSGARGYSGYLEKDAVLDISLELKWLIEKKLGINCILTRKTDVFIALGERAKIANDNSCDLFLSIHCNACKDRSAYGAEVYFFAAAKTNWARAVEARENASLKYEGKTPEASVEYILWDMAQTEFLEESSILCKHILDALSKQAKRRFVSQANFAVLRSAYMPACLIEVEFISNKEGERRLKTRKFKKECAKQIFEGIKAYKKFYEKKMSYE